MSNYSVNGPNCSYMGLGKYNTVQRNSGSVGMPYVPPNNISGYYVVPDYKTINYDALTHGDEPSCAGYFNITGGYGRNAENCETNYYKRPCM